MLNGIKVCSDGEVKVIEYDNDVILEIADLERFVDDTGTSEFGEVETFSYNGILYVICGYTEGYAPTRFDLPRETTYGDLIVYGLLDSDNREPISIRAFDFLEFLDGENLLDTIIEDEMFIGEPEEENEYDYSDSFIASEDDESLDDAVP